MQLKDTVHIMQAELREANAKVRRLITSMARRNFDTSDIALGCRGEVRCMGGYAGPRRVSKHCRHGGIPEGCGKGAKDGRQPGQLLIHELIDVLH